MAHTLAVWLNGTSIAELSERRTGKLSLEYTDTALTLWPFGTPLLSVSLQTRPDRRHSPSRVTPYFEGLLPEGAARNVIEDRFGVRRGDVFRLLAAIGRDCAGAVVIQPEADDPPGVWHMPSGGVLSDDDLRDEIAALGTRPLGAGGEVRVSLAGQQDKLLLTRDSQGRWLRAEGSTPSTHIFKPEDSRFPDSAFNEAFCLTLGYLCGLTPTPAEIIDLGRPVLVVPRYDRARNEQGAVSRIHQEDMCQALSVPVDFSGEAKYEAAGGPSFSQVARILGSHAASPLTEIEKLIQVMAFAVAIGNADAHGKNISLLHDPDGSVTLAPVYDVMCTTWYHDVVTPQGALPVSTNLAMSINGVRDVHEVTFDDVVAEAVGWRIGARLARSAVSDLLENLNDAIDHAADESSNDVSQLAAFIAARVNALDSGRPAGKRA